jgi:hypothetical protein
MTDDEPDPKPEDGIADVAAMFQFQIEALEASLFMIGEAILKPGGFEDVGRLHTYVYETAWRALSGSSHGEALDRMRFGE